MSDTPIIGHRYCATIASGQSKGKTMIGILEYYNCQQGSAILNNEQGWMYCVLYSTLTQELTDEELMQLLNGTGVTLNTAIKAL